MCFVRYYIKDKLFPNFYFIFYRTYLRDDYLVKKPVTMALKVGYTYYLNRQFCIKKLYYTELVQ